MSPVKTNEGWSLPKKRVLRRLLRSDPGQEFFIYVPRSGGREAPMLVSVHGVSRNAEEQARLFSPYADAMGVVLVAPHFTAERFSSYQKLGSAHGGDRADAILDAIVEEAAWLTGATTSQIYLFGYSGGAQFTHRYVMAHPHKVARAVVASAGWYTFPDPVTKFPYGIRPSRKLPGLRFDPEAFLRVPITVLIGEHDETSGRLRRSARLDKQQGATRVERARSWVAAMRAAADAYRLEPLVSLNLVEGRNHSFREFMKYGHLGARVFEALFALPFSQTGDGGNGKLP